MLHQISSHHKHPNSLIQVNDRSGRHIRQFQIRLVMNKTGIWSANSRFS
jgi:glycerol-3-phosphate dehydrogenase